ncbi:hypothetical protein [Psychromarinibacter sp. S121]|uniref:hypothetical protein n=1 Tax=Psychromarinibacter sp. S121 TaxID=3415127 RepID=UPI003C7C67EA
MALTQTHPAADTKHPQPTRDKTRRTMRPQRTKESNMAFTQEIAGFEAGLVRHMREELSLARRAAAKRGKTGTAEAR